MSEQDEMIADGLAYVCAHLDDLRAVLDDPLPLERVLEAVRTGVDPERPLRELHTAVQVAGDAFGILGAGTRALRDAPGIARGPVDLVYLCPSGGCTRFEWESARCVLHGEDMRRERLP